MPEILFLVGGLGGVLLSIGVIVYAANLMLKQREEKRRKREAEAIREQSRATEATDSPAMPSAASVPPAAASLRRAAACPLDMPWRSPGQADWPSGQSRGTSWEAALRAAPASSKYQTEVARLLRDKDTGELIVEMDGRQYLKAKDIKEDDAGRRLVSAARELMNWLGLPAGAREVPSPSIPPPNPPLDLVIPSMKPLEQIRILRERAKLPKPAPPKSVAEQIDDVLQRQIGGTSLAERGVKLLTTPGGGARVQVGAQFYDAVDAVPDEEIRQAIREAVKAWEARRGS